MDASASRRGGSVGHLGNTPTIAFLSSPSVSTRPRVRSASTPATTTTRRPCSVAARATPTKPMPAWHGIYNFVTKRNLETAPPRGLRPRLEEGLGCRRRPPRKRHEQSAPDLGDGIASVPLYRHAGTFRSRADPLPPRGHLGLPGRRASPEQNEEFVEKILDLLSSGGGGKRGLLMLCEVGGSLTPTASFPTGKTSRSLQAAFRALEAGVELGEAASTSAGGCFRVGLGRGRGRGFS